MLLLIIFDMFNNAGKYFEIINVLVRTTEFQQDNYKSLYTRHLYGR